MKPTEIAAVVQGVAPVVREFVSKEVRPLGDRLKSLEDRITSGELKGDPGERGADGVNGVDGKDGATGLNGKDGEPGAKGDPGERGPQGEPGPAGKDGAPGQGGAQGERGEPGEKGADGKDGAQGLKGDPGERGEKGEPGEMGQKGDPGEKGLDGAPGRDGMDGAPGEKGDPGMDGRDGQKGDPGRDALQIEVLDGLDPQKSYQRGTYASFRGGIIRSFKVTAPIGDGELEKAGWHVIVRGIADLAVEIGDDLRTLALKFTMTDGKTLNKTMALPVVIHRGIWKEGDDYARGDSATRDGSTWILMADQQKGKPGEDGSGWVLSVKRGRDGKDGLRGEKGDRGAEGRPGKDLTQIGPNGGKW